MADLKIYQPLNFLTRTVYFGESLESTASRIVFFYTDRGLGLLDRIADDGEWNLAEQLTEFGGSFTYPEDGGISGPIETFAMTAFGIPQFNATGIDTPALTLFEEVESRAEGGVEGIDFFSFEDDDDIVFLLVPLGDLMRIVLGQNDSITGSVGADYILGYDGNDLIEGNGGLDTLVGGDGDDTITAGDGDAILAGEGGNDSIVGGGGNDRLSGSDGNDTVEGFGGNDNIGGGPGDDVLTGNSGNDTLGGGLGDDSVHGGYGNDVMAGGPGDDLMSGEKGDDTMGASFGDDTVYGSWGRDSLGGGTGSDLLDGGRHDDAIGGGEGNDTVLGGDGDDFLAGGGRHDSVDGGNGLDTINGGSGNDTLTGGTGADMFVFNSMNTGEADLVTDFEDGLDRIRLGGVEGMGRQGRFDGLDIADAMIDGTAGATVSYHGHVISMIGVSAADLGVSDFVFV
ncbi:calcium-binding protein [Puniceibacterium sp. IMCC21224]|uniref:calcium-binding protein n=1 Tax=Puniceibacterium sp. IMCC21224 TaxID=1618204 RepID=UPI00065CD83A|nr:calcium-binding protein [Puniceibacterium sp. IMCC21224]KMK67516.1 putative calcium-binding protein [Puniceibacterium sp. IMCC21224]